MPEDFRTDQELIAAANQCDKPAFEVLYFRYRDWVVALAYRFTSDREMALDVMQEAFIYFLRKFPEFTLTCQLKTFFYPVIRNLSISACRKARRYQSGEGTMERIEAEMGVDAVPREGAMDDLEIVLAGLSPEQKEVLRLRFIDGMSLAEIAAAMEIPLGTVKSRLHNALETLRQDERTRTFFGR